jgi:hypothetical protein
MAVALVAMKDCVANFMEGSAFERTYGSGGGLRPRRGNPKGGFGME